MRKNESRFFRAFFYLLAIVTVIVFISMVSACSCDDDEKHKKRKLGHTVNSAEIDVDNDGDADRIYYFTLDDDGNIIQEDQDWGYNGTIDRRGYFDYDNGKLTSEEWVDDENFIPPVSEDFPPFDRTINYDVDGKITEEEVDEDRDDTTPPLVGTYTYKAFGKVDEIVWTGDPLLVVGPSTRTYNYEPEGNVVRKEIDDGNDDVIDRAIDFTYGTNLIREYYDNDNDGLYDQIGTYTYNEDEFIDQFTWDDDNNGTIDLISYYDYTYEEDDYGRTTKVVDDWSVGDVSKEDSAKYLYSRYTERYDEKTRNYIEYINDDPITGDPYDEYHIYQYEYDNNLIRLTQIDHYPDDDADNLLGTEYVRQWVTSGAAEGEPLRTEYYNRGRKRYEYEKNYTYYPDGKLWTIDYDDYYDNEEDYTITYTYYSGDPEDGYIETISLNYPNNIALNRTTRRLYTSVSFDDGKLVYMEEDYGDNGSINARNYFLSDIFGNVEKRVKDEAINGWEDDPYDPFSDSDPDVLEEFTYNYDKFMFVDKKEYDYDYIPDFIDIDRTDYFTYDVSYSYLMREDRDLENDGSLFGDTVIKYDNVEGTTTQELWDTDYDGVTYDDLTFDPDSEYSYVIYDNLKYYKKAFDDYSVGSVGSIEDVTYYYYDSYLVEEEIDYYDDDDIDAVVYYTYDYDWHCVKEQWDDDNDGTIDRTWTRGVKINGEWWYAWYDDDGRLLREDYDPGDGRSVVRKKYFWDNEDAWECYPYVGTIPSGGG